MNATHLHLILNHLPMLGVVIAGVLFGIALWYDNVQFQRLTLGLIALFALTAIPVYLTGEPAQHVVERLAGVSEAAIDRHEHAASIALGAVEGLGGLALLGMLIFRRARAIPRGFAASVLVFALAVSGLFGWTGYLGGQIRHTEIRADAPVSGRAGFDASSDAGQPGRAHSKKPARTGAEHR